MGWLSDILGLNKTRRSAESVEARDIGLDEMASVLEEKMQNRNVMIEDELKKMHRSMVESSRSFANALDELRNSPGPSRVDERVMNIASSYRATAIKAFNNAFIEFARPVKYTVSDFDDYFGKCSTCMTEAENNINRFITPLKEVFPGSMNNLMKRSKELSDVMAGVKSEIDNKSRDVRPVLDALKLVRDLKSSLEAISEKAADLEKEKSSLSGMEEKRKSLQEELANLEGGEEWKAYQAKIQDARALERKKDEIRSVVLQSLVPLDKAMKRLKKLASESEEPFEHADMLDLYIEDPVSAFLRDKDLSAINKIIQRVRALAKSGSLEVDDRKGQKIMEKISSIQSENLLKNLRKDYDEFEGSERELQEGIKSAEVAGKKSGIERQLKNVESEISHTKDRVGEIGSMLDKMNERKAEIFGQIRSVEHQLLGEKMRLKDL